MTVIKSSTPYVSNSSLSSFFFQVRIGEVPGWLAGEFFSSREVTDRNNAQSLWEGSAAEQPILTSPTLLQISSDDSGDTGIELIVSALDANYDMVNLIEELDGVDAQTPVQIGTTSVLRENGFQVNGMTSPAGTVYLSPLGDTVVGGVPNNPIAVITLDPEFQNSVIPGTYSDNAARGSRFTIPRGYDAVIPSIKISAFTSNEELEFYGRARNVMRDVWTNRYPLPVIGGYTTEAIQGNDFIFLPEMTDLGYWANKLTGTDSRGIVKTTYYLKDRSVK